MVFPENILGRGLRCSRELPTFCFQIQMKTLWEERPDFLWHRFVYFHLLNALLRLFSFTSLFNNPSKKWAFYYQLHIWPECMCTCQYKYRMQQRKIKERSHECFILQFITDNVNISHFLNTKKSTIALHYPKKMKGLPVWLVMRKKLSNPLKSSWTSL